MGMSTVERVISLVQAGARIVIRYEMGASIVYQKFDTMYWTWTYTGVNHNSAGMTQAYDMVRAVLEMLDIGEGTLL
jgi:hypothetical protein